MSDLAPGLKAADNRWVISGPLTMDTVADLLAASRSLAMPQPGTIALDRVDRVDSAAVALLLAWKRRGADEGAPLQFSAVPQSLLSLAQLYGVKEMLTS
jgi:phospholipid transport system transporter-binding protein